MKEANPFQTALKCPRCKDREDQHGDYGCLAPSGRRVCNCTKTGKELEVDRLAQPDGTTQRIRPPRHGSRVLRRLDGDHSPLTEA